MNRQGFLAKALGAVGLGALLPVVAEGAVKQAAPDVATHQVRREQCIEIAMDQWIEHRYPQTDTERLVLEALRNGWTRDHIELIAGDSFDFYGWLAVDPWRERWFKIVSRRYAAERVEAALRAVDPDTVRKPPPTNPYGPIKVGGTPT